MIPYFLKLRKNGVELRLRKRVLLVKFWYGLPLFVAWWAVKILFGIYLLRLVGLP